MFDALGLGRLVRATRVRLELRQEDVAQSAGLRRELVSDLENGRIGCLRLSEIDRITAVVDLRLTVEFRPKRGDLGHIGDVAHASLVNGIATLLEAAGWETSVEATGGAGAIDLLAYHPATRMLLVVEVKSRITDIQRMLRDLGHRTTSARAAAELYGWKPLQVSRLLVVGATSTQRRVVQRHAALFRSAFPVRTSEVRRWLRDPREPISGLLFQPYVARTDVIQASVIRVRRKAPKVRAEDAFWG